ncbi:MAG: hypothetical protein KF708_12050 [Pirellulales bacterium]|nr:hypothetical protein [Pirellulales bacterium]
MSRPLHFEQCGVAAALAAALLLFSSIAAVADDASEPATPAVAQTDDIQDVLFLVPDGAHLIRLHIRRGDLSYQARWGDYLVGLFERLDQDRSGDLDDRELARGPWAQLASARQQVERQIVSQPFGLLDFDTEVEDDRVSFSEFIGFLGPFCAAVQFTATPVGNNPYGGNAVASPTPWSGIGERLDVNQDERLTLDEVADPLRHLRKLDANDDEMFNVMELNPDVSPISFNRRIVRPAGAAQAPDRPAALGRLPEESPRGFIQRLIKTFDNGPTGDGGDGMLSALEWPVPEEHFASVDTNGNAQLDEEELLAWYAQLQPEVEAIVRCEAKKSDTPTVELCTPHGMASPAAGASATVTATKGQLTVRWTTSEVEIRASEKDSRQDQSQARKQIFQQADGDNNGYLDEAESRNYLGTNAFSQVDTDNNKMIFEEEWLAYFQAIEETNASRSEVRIGDNGSSLFQLLDANGDGRLSVRELRQLKAMLEQWDRDRDGSIQREDMPRRYRLEVGGASDSDNQLNGFLVFSAVPSMVTASPTLGPAWFQAMDRNSDGDISRREFLGERAAFDRLDTDGDGLISVDEAAKAK